jgi:hypothetical protein
MRLALYAETDANFIDGSAVWLAALAALLGRGGHEVTVLLRTSRRRDEVLAAVAPMPGVRLVDPTVFGPVPTTGLSARQALHRLKVLDTAAGFDAVIIRGRRSVCRAAASERFRGRLIFYLTDFPQRPVSLWLRRGTIARNLRQASLLLCQTPEIADFLRRNYALPETLAIALLPPIADDRAFAGAPARPPEPGETVRLAYIGKFSRAWKTLAMTRLPAALARRGQVAELHIAGSKFVAGLDPLFARRMRARLRAAGVHWRGALPRSAALNLAAACHIGLSWRAAALDRSLELSTKLIDYGAVGLPVICNPTPMHRRLLGKDYPLFAATETEIVAAVLRAAADPAVWHTASAAVAALAARHRGETVGAGLAVALERVFGNGVQAAVPAGVDCAA